MKEGHSYEISREQVQDAYRRVKANQGAAGIDGVTFEIFECDRENNLYKLWNRMSSGCYFPKAVKGVEIPKRNGKKRLLGVPTILDRVAQMVVVMNFEPLVEPVFCDNSYGYRPNRSALDAVRVTRERCWKMPWVLEFDIKGLFDNIDHELMMRAVRKHTDCKWILLYIERFLKADMVMPDGTTVKRTSGTPQGGVISPVLANLFMHYAFDRWMEQQNPGNPWARYADDAVIHCQTKEEAEALLTKLKARLQECKLEVHPDKTRIVYCHSGKNTERHEHESFDFLGYTFRCRKVLTKFGTFYSGFTPAVSHAAVVRFREKMRDCREQEKSGTPKELADRMNPIIRGWWNYYMKFCPSEARRRALDYVNPLIVNWARRRYGKMCSGRRKPYRWLCAFAKIKPDLFYHWQLGLRPARG